MAIRKQEFYEGAAIHQLARKGHINELRCEGPLFIFNEGVSVLFKYSTRGRSPWAFTVMPDERLALEGQAASRRVFLALVCGSDGVAAVRFEAVQEILPDHARAAHISCYRLHGEWYEVNGPAGTLKDKVAPASWSKILP